MLQDANFLPAPLIVFTILHVLTLSLHFAAMNFLVGGIVFVLAGRFERRWENPVVRRFVALFPSALAATVTLGVAPLLFLQAVYPRQTYAAAIVSAWFWILIIPAVVIAYYLLYAAAHAGEHSAAPMKKYLWPALIGLLYVSAAYSSVFSLSERPGIIHELYSQNQSGMQWNPEVGDYLLRWLHMLLGALTVGGFFAGWLGKDDPEASAFAKRMYTYGMLAASAAGMAYMVSLGDQVAAFMRGPAIRYVVAGIVLSLVSLHFFYKRRFKSAGAALFGSLLLMVLTRHELRLLRLRGQFDPASWRIAPQWSPLIIFVVSLLVAVAVVFYMLRLFFDRHRNPHTGSRAG